MTLGRTIQKTKKLFHKTLRNLESALFRGYHKLPRVPSLKRFSSINTNPKLHNFYGGLGEHWESGYKEDNEEKKKGNSVSVSVKRASVEEVDSRESVGSHEEQQADKNAQEERKNQEEKKGREEGRQIEGTRNKFITREPRVLNKSGHGGGEVLAQKMKELEMMNVDDDLDHVLDVEEVLICYSLLKSPVYLDIVDQFFMDMYSDFFLPQPSVSRVGSSMRRLAPLKL